MTRLILMRHGNTFEMNDIPVQIGARTDLPLTAFGQEQARKAALFLKNDPVQAIFAGGLKRQNETASIIGTHFGLNVQYTPALTEIDYGLWEGLSADVIEQKWPKEYDEWTQEAKWQHHIFQKSSETHLQDLMNWFQSLLVFETVLGITSNGLLRFFKKEKVKTGHLCELFLYSDRIECGFWNQPTNFC